MARTVNPDHPRMPMYAYRMAEEDHDAFKLICKKKKIKMSKFIRDSIINALENVLNNKEVV